MLFLWILVFVVALAVLVKGADLLLGSAEKIGLAFGLSPFIIGVVVIGFGTSLPELASSIAGVLSGVPELVAGNVIGSNIANILLIAGFAAIASKRLVVGKNLVDLDIPLLAISTIFFVVVAYDGTITRLESAILLAAFLIYLIYAILHKDETPRGAEEIAAYETEHRGLTKNERVSVRDVIFLVLGLALLIGGARYLVLSVEELALMLGVGVGLISLVAVAVGTSLPELVVSVRAGWEGKSDVALGNIFGSNVFNALFVVGVPGLITALPIDAQSLTIGLPVMVGTTILFLISTLSNRFHNYEGALYILLYALFLGKLSGVL